MKYLFCILFIIALYLGGVWITRMPYFQIAAITIVNDNGSDKLDYASKQRIFDSVKPHLTGSFFMVNVHEAKRAAESTGWVRHARIDRIPPSLIKITVSEYEPAARWIREGHQAGLISADGTVFQAAYQGELPEFDGDIRHHKLMLEQYKVFSTRLKSLRLKILRLQYSPHASWTMMLNNGIELRLGKDNVHARLNRFVEAYPSILSPQAASLDYVDMRYSDAFATRLRSDIPKPNSTNESEKINTPTKRKTR